MIRITLCWLFFLLPGAQGQQDRSQKRFDQWDRNGDGKLSKEELPKNVRKNFERIDKNGDGFVSREEDAAMVRRLLQNLGQGRSTLPDGVKLIADLDYAGNENPRQKLDLYLPEKAAGDQPLPVIAFIHGGGWGKGDKASARGKIVPYVATGKYAAISIGYRLSDEAQWPAQIHDCKAGIRWIRANAEKYHLDGSRIAVWGTSAGGHLVAMLGVSHEVEGFEGDIGPHQDQSSEVRCVIDFFGPSELLTMNDHPSTIDHDAADSPESKLIGGPIQENRERATNASPIAHVSADDEPFLIVHGDGDPLVPYPQSADFEKKLESAGVPVILVTVAGGEHGKGFGPSVNQIVEAFLAVQLLGKEQSLDDLILKAGE